MRTFKYTVYHPGELSAGILSYADIVIITVENDPGGDDAGEYSFREFMLCSLKDWFDGAIVEEY